MDFSTNEWRKQLFHSIPVGWWLSFGEQMCDDIENELQKMLPGAREDFTIYEIKELNGSLHFKTNWITNNLQEIFNKYKDLSIHTCVHCGRPSECYAWEVAKPYCIYHAPENTIELNQYLINALKEV